VGERRPRLPEGLERGEWEILASNVDQPSARAARTRLNPSMIARPVARATAATPP